MNSQSESDVSVVDIVKQVFSAFLAIAGIAAFYHFSEVPLIYRVLGILVVFSLVVAMLFTTALGQMVWGFAQEAKIEVKKVVWPTREETVRTTLMVFAMVSVVGIVLWVLDTLLFFGVQFLTGQGG